jgi:hypothetical protein
MVFDYLHVIRLFWLLLIKYLETQEKISGYFSKGVEFERTMKLFAILIDVKGFLSALHFVPAT